jgi:hypothetical protein
MHHLVVMSPSDNPALIEAPVSNAVAAYETLGYVEGRDDVLDLDYAFVAYKETSRATGEWRVRIRSSRTGGAVFEPLLMAYNARVAWGEGRSWFSWGYSLEPQAGDPRMIQFRVHVRDGQPAEVEMLLRLRRSDHSAGELRTARFAWPHEEHVGSRAA